MDVNISMALLRKLFQATEHSHTGGLTIYSARNTLVRINEMLPRGLDKSHKALDDLCTMTEYTDKRIASLYILASMHVRLRTASFSGSLPDTVDKVF